LGNVKKYADLGAMLADPDLDLIDVCNPTNLHPETAVAALKAGKHVLVEKAIALEPGQADAMVREAGRAGKLLTVAHVLPFFPDFAFPAEAVRGGKSGRPAGADLTRGTSPPAS